MKSTEHPVGINELGMSFLFRGHTRITQDMSFLFFSKPIPLCWGVTKWNLSNIELKDNCAVGGSHLGSSFAGPFGQEERSVNYWLGGVSLATSFFLLYASGIVIWTRTPHTGHFPNTYCAGRKTAFDAVGWSQGNYLHDIMIFLTGKFQGGKRLVWLLNNYRQIHSLCFYTQTHTHRYIVIYWLYLALVFFKTTSLL